MSLHPALPLLLFLPPAVLSLEVTGVMVWPDPIGRETALTLSLSFVQVGAWEEGGE